MSVDFAKQHEPITDLFPQPASPEEWVALNVSLLDHDTAVSPHGQSASDAVLAGAIVMDVIGS